MPSESKFYKSETTKTIEEDTMKNLNAKITFDYFYNKVAVTYK